MADDLVGIGKAVSRAIESGEKFLERLIGPWLDEKGQSLADAIREKRRQNLAAIAAQAAAMTSIKTTSVPGRILFPILEAAANEDAPDLQMRWAALLAHSIQDELTLPAYAELLRQLTSLHAQVLDFVFRHSRILPRSKQTKSTVYMFLSVQRAEILRKFKISISTYNLLAADLQRLGVVEGGTLEYGNAGKGGVMGSTFSQIGLTTLGQSFVPAVNPPGADLGGVYVTPVGSRETIDDLKEAVRTGLRQPRHSK